MCDSSVGSDPERPDGDYTRGRESTRASYGLFIGSPEMCIDNTNMAEMNRRLNQKLSNYILTIGLLHYKILMEL